MPAPLRAPGEAGNPPDLRFVAMPVGPIANHDLTELFVARQQPVKRVELA